MCRVIAALMALLTIAIPSFAQRIKTVSGTYLYVIPETQSLTQARETAVERAKIQILADTYGTVIDMSAATSITGEGIQTRALSQSQVKGEWIETIGEPIITRYFDGDQLALKVEIQGKVREIASASTEFTAKILCGVPDLRFEGDTFKNGDNIFLYFQAPGDGFLAVYLYDGADDVYCLLPYQKQGNGIFEVKGGKPYILFSADISDGQTPYSWVDEYTLTASSEVEMNRIYVIYSPNKFTKALDDQKTSSLPRELSFESFQQWLSRIRMADLSVALKNIDITIKSRL